ncbi:SurA N-terminal domain-containing protein [Blattabacterium cuenoti]|uniref:SurA N-terminal domain-containing protein n=1 Tax=Blattabacterium cuenoti TaxID=1653831 RepID=UPI00163B7277|nr:SurA N-terminal domain-containing protein [Blattabacterium cuenoti]
MSLLEKIRKNTWILFLFIGISLFLFILDPNVLLKIFSENPNIIGKVNGENIFIKEYIDCFQFLKRFRQGEPDAYLKNEAWKLLIYEKILNQQAVKLGIQSTKKDFWNAVAKQSIYSNISDFHDFNGEMDLEKFQSYLKKLEKTSKISNPQIEEEKNIWSYEKKNIIKRIFAKKYIEMLMYGLNTSLVEAELNYKDKNFFSFIDYIFIPYSEIENRYKNMFLINDNEIYDYIEKHKFFYKKENIRSLSFVIFRSEPSLDDENKMRKKMKELFHQFQSTNQDSIFVSNQSEKPFDSNFYLKRSLPTVLQNFISKNNQIGSIFGPIKEENIYIMAKLTGKKMISDSVLVSHILISHKNAIRSSNHKRTKKEAKKISENIYNTLKKNPYLFDFFVRKKSDDLINAKKNKGSLGWMKYEDQNSIGSFDIFALKNKKGTIGITETKFGYHILRIDNKSIPIPAYQFAIILKTLTPSKKTEDSLYKKVRKFLIKNKNSSLNTFINHARKNKYETIFLKNVRFSQSNIDELNTEVDKEIIHWAFEKNRKKRDCKIISTSNKDYILVYLSKIQNRVFSIEEIKKNLIFFLKKEKIDRFLSKMMKEKFPNKNLEKIGFYFSKKIKKSYKINFHDSMIDDHKEPKVVGFASSLKLYETSKPILGEKGIFFVRPLKHIFPYKKPSYFSSEMEVLNSYLRKNYLENLGRVLIDKSIIKDYRNRKNI